MVSKTNPDDDVCEKCACFSCYNDPIECEFGNISPCCYCISPREDFLIYCAGWTEVK
jgi:hypothetical protein